MKPSECKQLRPGNTVFFKEQDGSTQGKVLRVHPIPGRVLVVVQTDNGKTITLLPADIRAIDLRQQKAEPN